MLKSALRGEVLYKCSPCTPLSIHELRAGRDWSGEKSNAISSSLKAGLILFSWAKLFHYYMQTCRPTGCASWSTGLARGLKD